MFICHKCGYKDLSDKEKTSCPICGANIIVPKFALILFLSLVFFIAFTFLSIFEDKLHILSTIFIIIAGISLPFAIMEAIENSNKTQDGFKAPDYPSEVQKGSARVPNFKEYDYVFGIRDDAGIKKIMIEVYDEGLNIFYNKLQEIETINYSDITGLEIHSETELKKSTGKSIIYGAVLGALGGLGAGMLGATLGGIDAKEKYVLEIKFNEDNLEKSLYVTSSLAELEVLAYGIEDKVNGK